MDEEWKPLIYQQKSFPNFEVSNIGRLRNVNTGTIYKQHINKNGYYQVCVSLGGRNNKKVFRIHKAVAETFIQNPYNKPQVNHIDGNKINNCVDNLEWVTSLENSYHALKTGLMIPIKSNKDVRRLTDDQAEYIRNNYIPYDKEFGSRALGRKFGITHVSIMDVLNNKTYKYKGYDC